MRLPWPRSVVGQTLAVLVLMLAVSNAIGITVYALDRRAAIVATEAHDFADRVVGMVDLVRHLPPEWRDGVVREADGRTFHVTLDPRPDLPGDDLDAALSADVADQLARQIDGVAVGDVRVAFTAMPFVPRVRDDGAAASGDAADTRLFLHISVRLGTAEWLNFVGGMTRAEPVWLGSVTAYIVSIALGVGVLAIWLVVRVTAPFRAFAVAADRLGKDIRTEPLPETGPTDVAQAARAFNAMQRRVRRLVENRTQILGALSHDLKTPVTLLRLRTELMADAAERTKMLATLDEMEAMIASVLEFTRASLLNEPLRRVDLSALIASICEDMQDAGHAVSFEAAGRVMLDCRRVGLKRALTNLIDNAAKYGGGARVALARAEATILVEIDDDGPGIPEDRHESIFMPFARLDEARGEETGGTGLGLSIAQAIVHGHGGQIILANRPEGGLRVAVTLPV